MTPAEFRELLQRGGPGFITIGRFLASRPELLPQEMSDELIYLRDEVAPLPWHEVRAIVDEDLAAPIGSVFKTIDPRPIVAGALAQVHVGCLEDGTEVAVKVQRPDARTHLLPQLEKPAYLEDLLARAGCSPLLPVRELASELVDTVARELDFARELANLSRLHDLTAHDSHQLVPRPYPQLCGDRVLTLDSVRGVRLSDVLADLRLDQQDGKHGERGNTFDRHRFAENLTTTGLAQIFLHHFFQADLLPTNLLVLPDDTVAFIGFGHCYEPDPVVEERRMRHVSAMLGEDAEQMFSVMVGILAPSQETDLSELRRVLLSEIRLPRPGGLDDPNVESRAVTVERSPAAAGIVGMLRTAHRFGFRIPPDILAMYRAFITLDTVARQLGPDMDVQAASRSFLVRLQVTYALRSTEPDSLQSLLLSLLNLWRDGPAHLRQSLTQLREGTYTFETNALESARTTRRENRRTRLIVMGTLAIGVAILLSRPILPDVFGVSVIWPLGAALAALYLAILIQWRHG
jgi:ubiquinone biosynthesis protein